MNKERQDSGLLFGKKGRRTGLTIVVLAAVLLEAMTAIQYYYTRAMLERNLEAQVLIVLRAAAMRMDGVLNATVAQARNQAWHAQQHLGEPEYMETLVKNLAKDEGNKVTGAAVAFRPYYYAQKGQWYEPYAHREGDSVTVRQIGGANHDYMQLEFYKTSMRGDTLKWSTPYVDAEGALGEVTTYGMPLRDGHGVPVAALGIDISTEWLRKSLSDIRLHPSSFMMAMTEGGVVISAPADSLCSPQLAAKIAAMMRDPSVKKEEKVGGRVTCFTFYDDQQKRRGRVYYARKRFEPRWLLAKAVYDDETFGELAQMRRAILWMTLVGLLVLGGIIQLFARNGRKLSESLMQQQRSDRELQIANGIQQALLPQDEPSLLAASEVAVEGCLIPAREVGGDLYNAFVLGGKLFFCIGDVSGKGVPAALIMAVTQTLVHSIGSQEDNPADIMKRLNATACRNNHENMFVTLFVGVLDLKTGHLGYCNAGHERPYLMAAGRWSMLDCRPNMPIGLFDDFDYEMEEMTIAPGDMLFLYTDGLTEARNARHQLLGRERAEQLIDRCRDMEPKEMVARIVSETKQYAEHAEQSDDLTLLAIKYKGI